MMKIKSLLLTLFLFCVTNFCFGQVINAEKIHGNTLNMGLGLGGYAGNYKYVGRTLVILQVNYEIGLGENTTIAPFLSFNSHSNPYYWGDISNDYKDYYFHETTFTLGASGSYYFNKILNINGNWSFYGAGSLGYTYSNSYWSNDYRGDKEHYKTAAPLFYDLHLGAEYHLNSELGFFMDISSSSTSIGICVHQTNKQN